MADNTFELGLVMAGAISAGAYTAGVMDFLIEALDAFEAAKAAPDWDGPTHTIRIPLMAGASAGGMTSAMAALQSFYEMEHVQPGKPPPAPEKNRLYANWVTRIDLKGLLETRDLDGDLIKQGVQSALCCKILDDIVHETFVMTGSPKPRAWLGHKDDRSLRVVVTLTNLRGVPYSFQIVGADAQPYATLNHGDYLDFKIGLSPSSTPGTTALDIATTTTPDWEAFRTAALATGAFPIGLAPRLLNKQVIDYATSVRVGHDTPDGFQPIPPDATIKGANPYAFVAVDGGTIDNEPLEIGRRLLAQGGVLDDDGVTVRKAIVLIAPFPNFVELPTDDLKLAITRVFPRLASTLVQQSRFKPDELAKATNEKFFSRFLISPERDGRDGKPVKKYPIASGVLHGFGGFIDESFRRHDFLLGRRNAQAFLRFHLALPETHKLFEATKSRDKWYVYEPPTPGGGDGAKKRFAPTTTDAPSEFGLPIIPLCGGLDREIVIGAADQPKPSAIDKFALDDLIQARVQKVVEALVEYDLRELTQDSWFGWAKRLGARQYLTQVLTKQASKSIAGAIDDVARAFA